MEEPLVEMTPKEGLFHLDKLLQLPCLEEGDRTMISKITEKLEKLQVNQRRQMKITDL